MSNMRKDSFSVEVIGFNQTERIVLSSIFGLSARRTPKFLQHTTVMYSPDLFLVDANDNHAMALFHERNAARRVPCILIGDSDHGTNYPVLARPLQWTRLFKAFDLALADQPAQASDFETTLPNAVIAASLQPVGVPPAVIAPNPPAFMATSPAAIVTAAAASAVTSATAPAAPAAIQFAIPSNPIAPIIPTAHVSQPAAPDATAPAKSMWTPPPIHTPHTPPTPSAQADDKDWVLVVDDNLTVREFMRSKLAPFNMNVDFAETGEQAADLASKRRYTCVFLDVVMPGMDGYQVCKLIKAKKAANTIGKTAVVMLTSKGSPFDKIRGAMAGCDAYLTKPVDEEKLLFTIAKFLPKMA